MPVSFVPPHKDRQRLSYGAFANPVYSTSSDNPQSPGPDTSGPSQAAGSQGKGKLRRPVGLKLKVPRVFLTGPENPERVLRKDFGGGSEDIERFLKAVQKGFWALEEALNVIHKALRGFQMFLNVTQN